MHICTSCEIECGGKEQPAIYQYQKQDFCDKCMSSINRGMKMSVDYAVDESKRFLKRLASGTYMKENDSNTGILGYGKKE